MQTVRYIAGTLMTGEAFVNRLVTNEGDVISCQEIGRFASWNWANDVANSLNKTMTM